MQPPPQLVQWLRQNYPKPSVDEHWLSQCYAWVVEEHSLNPATDMGQIREQVESQLLMSDLTDSMVHGTGLPHDLAGLQKGSLSGPPVLVQILALTEIGHSAFNLMNVRQTKVDRADLSGLAARGDNEEGADEGPIPNYPRSMLQFELSDGAITLKAIEYRKIPQLDLENTPLGFKIQLKNVSIRHGIAFLEPRNIVLKGHSVEDLDVNRDRHFLRGLRLRLDPHAQQDPEGDGQGEGEVREVQVPPAPAPAPAIRNAPPPMPTTVPNARRTAQTRVDATTARQVAPPIPGPSNGATRLPPPSAANNQLSQPRPLTRNGRQPGPSALSTYRAAPATSSHFSTPGTTVVNPMRLSPTRAATEPLEDEPSEHGSDWYFGHDGIDASFISRAASELERTEAQLSQSSQPSLSQPQQSQKEVISIGDEGDDKENTSTGRRVVRRTLRRQQLQISSRSVVDLSAEITEDSRIQRPVDNDDVIRVGSND